MTREQHWLMTGPCLLCRRAMNWTAWDPACWATCRYCLGYITSAARWVPAYAALLINTANRLAAERGDPLRIAVIRERKAA